MTITIAYQVEQTDAGWLVWRTLGDACLLYPYHTTHDVLLWPQELALPAGAYVAVE